MGPIRNMKGIETILIWDDASNNQQIEYPVPEKFTIDVGENKPVFDITILCKFRKDQIPFLKVLSHELFIYMPVVEFEFGNNKKCKRYLLVRHEKGESK